MNEMKVRSRNRRSWPWSGIMLLVCLLGFAFLGAVFLAVLVCPADGLPLRICHAVGSIIGAVVGLVGWFLGLWLFATPPSDQAISAYRISD